MKSIQVASIALAAQAFAGMAQAADIKAPAPPPAIAASSSWTGFYTGLGLGFRASRTDLTSTSLTFAGIPIPQESFADAPTTLSFNGTALRASPYIGFNWQLAPRWIASIEGDFGFANQTTTIAGFRFASVFGSGSRQADGLAVKATWDASLRGRLGFLLTPVTMVYMTSGAAWQHFNVSSSCESSLCVNSQLNPAVIANSMLRPGWTVGGGIEIAVGSRWLARAEYRYANLGSAPFTIARSTVAPNLNPTIETTDVAMQAHTVTFGLAYKFGNPVENSDDRSTTLATATATAMAPAAMPWNGPYIGLGVGARASRTDVTTVSVTQAGVPLGLDGRATSQSIDGIAFRLIPYLGFNWQIAPQWVVGIEGDAGFANQPATLPGFAFSPGNFVTSEEPDRLSVKTTWEASLRGRFGYLLTPATLAYLTGGGAWQHYEVTSVCAGIAVCETANGFSFFSPATITNTTTKAGWTVGGGIETALRTNWLVRGEYRYADFGASSFVIARSNSNPALNPVVDTFDVKLRTHAVTFGLAYRFN